MPDSPSSRNRSVQLDKAELKRLSHQLVRIPSDGGRLDDLHDQLIHGDLFELLDCLPDESVDLVFADPPYNMAKDFGTTKWREMPLEHYEDWLQTWLPAMRRLLKPAGSIYVCGDWKSSPAIYRVLSEHFCIQNRITWEREKGRGAKSNWKNCSEDIWFATCHQTDCTFNVNDVKLKRRVIAPYTTSKGKPKDWKRTREGDFRLTHPSNLWTDLTVPFWSMPENTPHPTQKPEKLLAKVILASSNPGDLVFDPFLGSGTTAVAAAKLGRHYCGIEISEEYACYALKRLELAEEIPQIQGYHDGLFYERNSRP